jgi:hypothetical protein
MPSILRLSTSIYCNVVPDDRNLVCWNFDNTLDGIPPNSWFPCSHNRIHMLPLAHWILQSSNAISFRVLTRAYFLNDLGPWRWLKILNQKTIWPLWVALGSNFKRAIHSGQLSPSASRTATK